VNFYYSEHAHDLPEDKTETDIPSEAAGLDTNSRPIPSHPSQLQDDEVLDKITEPKMDILLDSDPFGQHRSRSTTPHAHRSRRIAPPNPLGIFSSMVHDQGIFNSLVLHLNLDLDLKLIEF
jgi:hypothetical protein